MLGTSRKEIERDWTLGIGRNRISERHSGNEDKDRVGTEVFGERWKVEGLDVP